MSVGQYHGWTYSLDGKLKGVPGFGTTEDAKFGEFEGALSVQMMHLRCLMLVCSADKSQYSLWPMRVALWQGLVFVQALPPASAEGVALSGPEANALFERDNAAFCARLTRAAETAGGRALTDFHFYKGATHKLKCNWKVYVENYLEG